MFSFSKRRMRLGRLKVHLVDHNQGLRSPVRHTKRLSHSHVDNVASSSNNSFKPSSSDVETLNVPEFDLKNCTSGNSNNWMELYTHGEKPLPRFGHAATVVGNKMVVVGGDSGDGLLDDVQILDFNILTWSSAKPPPKNYFSPSSLPSKIPACKGHCLVTWGKNVLLVGGKCNPMTERISVWAFDTETECWSRVESKGDIPVARSGHSVTRSGSVLILFGGEDAKGRKLNDLHMFDLKSLMWLPLHFTGTGPSPRSNHVATLYNDRVLILFGGSSKSKIYNDLYSLDFETMVWSRIKNRGFHPSPRAGCCGVLLGSKWYIAGGGSKKKRYAETFVFDVLKSEWTLAVTPSSSSATTNKGFTLVFVRHKELGLLVAFGGTKKELSNQVEILALEQNKESACQISPVEKVSLRTESFPKSSSELNSQINKSGAHVSVDTVAKQNLKAALESSYSGRKSLSESSIEQTGAYGNTSLRKQFHNEEEYDMLQMKMQRSPEDDRGQVDDFSPNNTTIKSRLAASVLQFDSGKVSFVTEFDQSCSPQPENLMGRHKTISGHRSTSKDEMAFEELDGKSGGNASQLHETKLTAAMRKNAVLEGQLAAAMASRDALEKNLASVIKSRQDTEKKLADMWKELELHKEKLSSAELAQEEANSLSNIVHSDNVRLEHDVAFLKAVLDDTQKELQSTRGVLAGERARAFQLQVEVFHLKQRLQSIENRAPTPRKPYNA